MNTDEIGKVATTVRKSEGITVVTYHKTDVVRFNKDWIVLNSNLWRTATTKARMNQASNEFDLGYVVSKNRHSKGWKVRYQGEVLDFLDNMVLWRGGHHE